MTAIVKRLVAAGNNSNAALNATDEYAQKQLEEIVRDLTECKGAGWGEPVKARTVAPRNDLSSSPRGHVAAEDVTRSRMVGKGRG